MSTFLITMAITATALAVAGVLGVRERKRRRHRFLAALQAAPDVEILEQPDWPDPPLFAIRRGQITVRITAERHPDAPDEWHIEVDDVALAGRTTLAIQREGTVHQPGDIQIGLPALDDRFVFFGSDPGLVRATLLLPAVTAALASLSRRRQVTDLQVLPSGTLRLTATQWTGTLHDARTLTAAVVQLVRALDEALDLDPVKDPVRPVPPPSAQAAAVGAQSGAPVGVRIES